MEKEDWAPVGGDFNEDPEWTEAHKTAAPLSPESQDEVDRIRVKLGLSRIVHFELSDGGKVSWAEPISDTTDSTE